jgi:hypothetical protein
MGWIRANVSAAWEVGPRMQMGTYTRSPLRWNMGYRNATGHLLYAKNLSLLFLLVIPGAYRGPRRVRNLALGKVATRP